MGKIFAPLNNQLNDIFETTLSKLNFMQVDIKGKINEKRLSFAHTLLPLYEAIVNSIHAIEDRKLSAPGLIEVTMIRSNQQSLALEGEEKASPFQDFIIKDNGIGFTKDNFNSFDFAHSTYKSKRGGKGIGRFSWLRAFKKAEIESHFTEDGKWWLRKFNFEPTVKGIEKPSLVQNGEAKFHTEVRLKGLGIDYQKWCNTNLEEIAHKIIEHCFVYFLDENCPRIVINDKKDTIVVNDHFGLFTRGQVKSESIKIRNQSFSIDLVKIYSQRQDNKFHYCAHTREVQNERISSEIPELDNLIVDENNEKFSIAVYVTGKYLDDHVNEERTHIQFPKQTDSDIPYPDEVSLEELRKSVGEIVKKELSPYISKMSEARMDVVKNIINRHPQYKQLLKYKSSELARMRTNLPEADIEVELFKIQQSLDLEVKSEAKEILKFIDNVDEKEDFKKNFSALYDKIIEVGNSKLSEYIIHRKLVLDLLEKHLKKSTDGKFSKEDAVHNLIFPLKSISDDIGFEDHNLWVIDERLSYHKYLASDKRFKQIPPIKSQSADRPDIIIFNQPFAFTSDDKPYGSIVLIEFKRPMRDDYSDKENPITQVNRYAGEIAENDVLDKDGRSLDIRNNTPIYAYIVCDLTKNLRKFAKEAGYKPLPDNDGFFSFNDNYNLYVEIISFDKLVKDSKQRNKVLFEKLNLPSA
ncbi:ATP-binding protein [Pedobacter panaciterrae]|uniref:ATP-binding protein n=1 Tax=Pedobacter panaciterrae TaxID=363849 RepID=UPI002598962E|nr:ATP-binding protein [uncultured Pedobacter sp.]